MTDSWARAANGFWQTASNWTNGVPTAGSTALITANGTYTVTSNGYNSVGNLEMSKTATLVIGGNEFDITLGTGNGALAGTIKDRATLALGTKGMSTTFDNTGNIDLQSGSSGTAKLRIAGTVTLSGNGRINLSGNGAQIVADGSAATLINGDTISGQGLIGGPLLSFVNAASGIIDATSVDKTITIDANKFTNSGLIETTGSGNLFIETGITQTANGDIKVAGAGAVARLEFVTISGGVVSVGQGATLESVGSFLGSSVLKDQTSPIANAGEIAALSGDLIIEDSIQNTGTASLAVNNGVFFQITGTVTGGEATISGTGEMMFGGPSSAAVTFDAGSTGVLFLGDPTNFTGTVAGMSTNTGASIDLNNIAFGAHPIVSQLSANGVLTVTAGNIIDKIKIVGGGSFSATMAPNGSTLISDPPANPASVPNSSAQLLVQSMASFGASSGITGWSTGNLMENHTSSDFLAATSHHG